MRGALGVTPESVSGPLFRRRRQALNLGDDASQGLYHP
jgi:hypothetical protein